MTHDPEPTNPNVLPFRSVAFWMTTWLGFIVVLFNCYAVPVQFFEGDLYSAKMASFVFFLLQVPIAPALMVVARLLSRGVFHRQWVFQTIVVAMIALSLCNVLFMIVPL